MEFGRKRGRQDGARNGGFKRPKEESEFGGVGSKSKPCMKFYSTTGCPFGENCHFLHYVPGHKAVNPMANFNSGPAPRSNPPPYDGPAPPVKTKMCNHINDPEGCRYGDKCRFAHSQAELGQPSYPFPDERRPGPPQMQPYYAPPSPPGGLPNFGASATAKISIDGGLAGAVIGKGGVNSKQICRITGVKLAVREHDSDPSQKNIELEGTFDQIKQASAIVRELIMNLGTSGGGGGGGGPPPPRHQYGGGGFGGGGGGFGGGSGNFKTKICENFMKGSCTFGDRCHFAHGENELRKPVG